MIRSNLEEYSIYRTNDTLDAYGQRGTTLIDTGDTIWVAVYLQGQGYANNNPKYQSSTHLGLTDNAISPQDYLAIDSEEVLYRVIGIEYGRFNRNNRVMLEEVEYNEFI